MCSQIFNLHWLEANLGLRWSQTEELECRLIWEDGVDQMIQSYPIHAYLLILRDYIMGANQDIESRLRRLIPLLSRLGDSGITLSALVLLGIFIMETQEMTDVVETLVEQVSPELSFASGSMEHTLYQYLLGQIAVKAGNHDAAGHHYEDVMSASLGIYEPFNFLLGRMYHKLGIYLLRSEGNTLVGKWKFRIDAWCHRYRNSLVSIALQQLGAGTVHQYSQPMHPLWAWRAAVPGTAAQSLMDDIAADIGYMRELDVIREITKARINRSVESAERALFTAETYADPFWTIEANDCLAAIKSNPPATRRIEVRELASEPILRVTFFQTFQGYTQANQVLFPPTYNRHKVRQMLAIILMQPRFQVLREQLMMYLFGEEHSSSGGNYLHVLLHRLRQLFLKQTGVGGDWVAVRNDMIFVYENRINSVDIEDYRKLAAVGHELWQTDKEAACDLYVKAVNMYHPVIAPEFEYEDWFASTRIFLEQQQRRMLKRLRLTDLQEGRMDAAIYRGEQLLALDPCDLTVLRELCDDWLQMGDTKTMQQVCQRTLEMVREEGDFVPEWLTMMARTGSFGFHQFEK